MERMVGGMGGVRRHTASSGYRPKQNKPQKTTTTTRLFHARTLLRQSSLARPARQAGGVSRGDLGVSMAVRGLSSRMVLAVEVEDLEVLELETMERMDKALEKLSENLMTVRTGRASQAMLDGVMVDYYGAPTPIKSLASITVQDGANIVVQPFDKGSLGEIEKAVRDADLGLSPTNDGSIVRINVPQLTAERRKDMVKVVGKFAEESKVAVRNIRRDCKKTLDKYQKDGLSEDLCKDKEADLQQMTDDYVKKIEGVVKAKEKEITTV